MKDKYEKALWVGTACLCMFLLMSFSFFTREKVPESSRIVGEILQEAAKTLKKKYSIRPAATNISMPDGIVKLLGVDFQIEIGHVSKEKIREILVHAVQDFLAIVRKHKEIKPYLENYPFEIKNIEIILFVNDTKGYWIQYPYIGIARISRGRLEYSTVIETYDPELKLDIPSITTEGEETYEKALIALGEEPKLR